jgi:hypothetical protein
MGGAAARERMDAEEGRRQAAKSKPKAAVKSSPRPKKNPMY